MRKMKLLSLISLLTLLCTLNTFAMNEVRDDNNGFTPKNPAVESENYKWIWLSNNLCVEHRVLESSNPQKIKRLYDAGLVSHWYDVAAGKLKTRDTYTGTWSQDESGIWSFVFDDYTIPVGLTKIDGVLYAFTGYGELKEGYEYWNGLKTGVDGVVTEDSPEFLAYLETQYLPECTTQKTE